MFAGSLPLYSIFCVDVCRKTSSDMLKASVICRATCGADWSLYFYQSLGLLSLSMLLCTISVSTQTRNLPVCTGNGRPISSTRRQNGRRHGRIRRRRQWRRLIRRRQRRRWRQPDGRRSRQMAMTMTMTTAQWATARQVTKSSSSRGGGDNCNH